MKSIKIAILISALILALMLSSASAGDYWVRQVFDSASASVHTPSLGGTSTCTTTVYSDTFDVSQYKDMLPFDLIRFFHYIDLPTGTDSVLDFDSAWIEVDLYNSLDGDNWMLISHDSIGAEHIADTNKIDAVDSGDDILGPLFYALFRIITYDSTSISESWDDTVKCESTLMGFRH